MNKTLNIKTLLFTLILAVISAGMIGFSGASTATAQNLRDKACAGSNFNLDPNATGGECKDKKATEAQNSINNLVTVFVNLFSVIVGIVAVIMIIVGGLKFITSGGDSGKVSSAKQTVLYALIGLIIVALAQFIVRFVLSKT